MSTFYVYIYISIVQHGLAETVHVSWPKPRWCSGRRLGQHELHPGNLNFSTIGIAAVLQTNPCHSEISGCRDGETQEFPTRSPSLKSRIHWDEPLHPTASEAKRSCALNLQPNMLVATLKLAGPMDFFPKTYSYQKTMMDMN